MRPCVAIALFLVACGPGTGPRHDAAVVPDLSTRATPPAPDLAFPLGSDPDLSGPQDLAASTGDLSATCVAANATCVSGGLRCCGTNVCDYTSKKCVPCTTQGNGNCGNIACCAGLTCGYHSSSSLYCSN